MDKFISIIPYAIMIFLLLSGGREFHLGIKSNSWEQVEGKILESSVISDQSASDENEQYKVKIRYSYTINGREYIGKQIYFGQLGFSFGFSYFAHRLVKKYPPDMDVIVYYNPERLNECVIEPGVKLISLFKIIIAVVIGVIVFKKKNDLTVQSEHR